MLITLTGSRFSQRMGTMLLTHLGLEDWAGITEEDYIAIAERAASDIESLAALRSQLRTRVAEFQLMRWGKLCSAAGYPVPTVVDGKDER